MMQRSFRGEGLFPKQFHDLGQRAASGFLLAGLALAITYAGGILFALLVIGIALTMSWEWGRIVRNGGMDTSFLVHGAAVALAIVLAAVGQFWLAAAMIVIGAAAVVALNFGAPTVVLSCLGVFYVGIPSLMLIMLRSDPTHGFIGVIFVLMVVWAVDTAAFIGGRGIGGPKLWPAVSPSKTWAGLISGVAAGVVVGVLFALWLPGPMIHLVLVSLLLGAVSQGGDLAESALKREFGVKDSSRLIPGHGGFLDRLDGVVAAATLAGVIGLVANFYAPARAMLLGT